MFDTEETQTSCFPAEVCSDKISVKGLRLSLVITFNLHCVMIVTLLTKPQSQPLQV